MPYVLALAQHLASSLNTEKYATVHSGPTLSWAFWNQTPEGGKD